MISQLFHPGREIVESANGMLAVAYSASASPNERFRMMPRAMDPAMISEIVAGYAGAARRMHEAGMDGVEFVASRLSAGAILNASTAAWMITAAVMKTACAFWSRRWRRCAPPLRMISSSGCARNERDEASLTLCRDAGRLPRASGPD